MAESARHERRPFLRCIVFVGAALALVPVRSASLPRVTVPMILDHNRTLIDAEIRRADGSRRKARFWIDSGSPDFIVGKSLAAELGNDRSGPGGKPDLAVRAGGMDLDFSEVKAVDSENPDWLFAATRADANLPSTVLKHHDVVFDYPGRTVTFAAPGSLDHRGVRVPARVNPANGIIQIEASVGGNIINMAVDLGASYSFITGGALDKLADGHAAWPRFRGSAGCANMWGWWPPRESDWQVVRLAALTMKGAVVEGVGIIGLPDSVLGGLGSWYSAKTLRPVDGFLGPNAFKAFRVEIDYRHACLYLEKTGDFDSHDMDTVGFILRVESDGSFSVTGTAAKNGKPVVEAVKPGDKLVAVGGLPVSGLTMGTVSGALAGKPGDIRVLVLERNGKRFTVTVPVVRLM